MVDYHAKFGTFQIFFKTFKIQITFIIIIKFFFFLSDGLPWPKNYHIISHLNLKERLESVIARRKGKERTRRDKLWFERMRTWQHMLNGVPMLFLGAHQWLKTRPHNVLCLSTHWRMIFWMGPTNIGPCNSPSQVLFFHVKQKISLFCMLLLIFHSS